MKRWIPGLILLALLTSVSLIGRPAGAQGGKVPTVKEIMGRLHKGANSPLTTIRADLQADAPDWPEIQRAAKNFVTLGAALGKNEPPQGDKQSWTRLTAQYLENSRFLEAAAQKQDKAGALAAHGRLNESCKGCHSVHRKD